MAGAVSDDLEPLLDTDPYPDNGGIRPDAGTALTIHDLIDDNHEKETRA